MRETSFGNHEKSVVNPMNIINVPFSPLASRLSQPRSVVCRKRTTIQSEECIGCLARGLRRLTRQSAGFDLVKCRTCGLVFTDPLLKGEDNEVGSSESVTTDPGFYANIIENHDQQEILAITKVARLLKMYKEKLSFIPKSVLEIGCGTGQYYRAWFENGVDWQGVEANPQMLMFCQQRGKPVIDVESRKSLQSNSYDLIYSSQVLEHVLDPGSFLTELRRLLCPDGLVHLDVPNHDSLLSRLRRLNLFSSDFGFIQPPCHLIAYRRKSLSLLMCRCGFEVVKIGGYPNNHRILGQLMVNASLLHRLVMAVDSILGTGSLLVCLARAK